MPPRRRKQPRGLHSPARTFRPYPPDVWDDAKAIAAARGESVTDVLNRALVDYVRRYGPPPKETP